MYKNGKKAQLYMINIYTRLYTNSKVASDLNKEALISKESGLTSNVGETVITILSYQRFQRNEILTKQRYLLGSSFQ